MAIYKQDIVDVELNSGTIHRSFLNHSIGSGDTAANRFGIRVLRAGVAVALAGVACQGYFRNANGENIALTSHGTVSGNVAYVTLPQACYNVEGNFTMSIKLIGGGVTGTMRIVDGVVDNTNTGGAVAPTESIPTYTEVLAVYDQAVDALVEVENIKSIVDNFPANKVLTGIVGITGTLTADNAWNINGAPVPGTQYNYNTIPVDATVGFMFVTGASWGTSYPLVSFYDENDELISTYGTAGNTRYTNEIVAVPANAETAIVNGYYSPYIAAASKPGGDTQDVFNRGAVQPFGSTIAPDFIDQNPDFSYFRNYPANRVYNLSNTAYTEIIDKPNGFESYGSLVKFVGYKNPVADHTGYSSYLLISSTSAWFGFDNGSNIIWHTLSADNARVRNILFIGDSYAQGYSHDGNNQGWCKYAAGFMGLSTTEYTISANGGASFSNSGNSFISLLNNAPTKDYTDIVLCGGFNDYQFSKSVIETNIATFAARAKTLYPNARLHIGCIGWIKEGTGSSAISDWEGVRTAITTNVIPAYQSISRYGGTYMTNTEYLLGESGLTPTDGYHPSEDGNKAIAQGVANAIIEGSAPIKYDSSLRAD